MNSSRLVPLCFIKGVSEGICHISGRTYILLLYHVWCPSINADVFPRLLSLLTVGMGRNIKWREVFSV